MEQLLQTLLGAGVAGAVLAYHLLEHAKNMKDLKAEVEKMRVQMSEAMDRATRTDLIRLIASPHVATDVKERAADMMKEIDAADTERKAEAESKK